MLNKARETLNRQINDLHRKIKVGKDATVNVPLLKQLLANVRGRLGGLDYEEKHQVLDSLDIVVWINGSSVAIKGVVNPEVAIVTNASYLNFLALPWRG